MGACRGHSKASLAPVDLTLEVVTPQELEAECSGLAARPILVVVARGVVLSQKRSFPRRRPTARSGNDSGPSAGRFSRLRREYEDYRASEDRPAQPMFPPAFRGSAYSAQIARLAKAMTAPMRASSNPPTSVDGQPSVPARLNHKLRPSLTLWLSAAARACTERGSR